MTTKQHDSLPVQTYAGLQAAYDHFNKELFDGRLPPCLITLRAAANSYGYYHTGRFAQADGKGKKYIDEIAMNPTHFAERSIQETLATLAHEMVHCEQAHFGKEPTRCYHDKQWASFMKRIGLQPSTTGKEGGKETGPTVSHYIIPKGRFATAVARFLVSMKKGLTLYQDRLAMLRALGRRPGKGKGKGGEEEGEGSEPKSKGRIKFTCPGCELNAWAKPSAKLRCIACNKNLKATEAATVGGDDDAD